MFGSPPRATAFWFAFCRGMVMNTARRVDADALLHRAGPALAEAARKALSPIAGAITDLMPLTRIGGWL